MLTQDKLIEYIRNDRTTGFIERLAKILTDEQYSINELIDLTFHPDKTIGFRAVWLLDTVMLSDLSAYADNLGYLLARITEVDNESCKRQYARIIMFATMPDASARVQQALEKIDLEPAIEKFFDWMIDPKVKVAVKAFAAEALFNMRNRYDWITEALADQLIFLMRDGGPAIQSKGKKLLAAINEKSRKQG